MFPVPSVEFISFTLAGHFCPALSHESIPCQPGTFQLKAKQASCENCTAGFFCSLDKKEPCPAGHYCPERTRFGTEFPCPRGTFSPLVTDPQKRQDINSCQPCPEGFVCDQPGMKEGKVKQCPDRWGLRANIISVLRLRCCDFCVFHFRHYCPLKTLAVILKPGGHEPLPCPARYYCAKGQRKLCPKGTYSNGEMLKSQDECIQCPMGFFCDGTGIKQRCSPGFFCKHKSEDATGGNSKCPRGFYCDQSTQFPLPCPEGTLGKADGFQNASQCEKCPAGSFCQDVGQSKVTGKCAEGFYCAAGSTEPRMSGKNCQAGQQCPEGRGTPSKCTGSNFSKWDFAAKCEVCPARFACKDGKNSEERRLGVETYSTNTFWVGRSLMGWCVDVNITWLKTRKLEFFLKSDFSTALIYLDFSIAIDC